MGADTFLKGKVKELSSLIDTPNEPFKDDSIHRKVVDLIRALKKVRQLSGEIEDELSVNLKPSIITYLNTEDD